MGVNLCINAFHDASVTIIEDGKVIAHLLEERHKNMKHATDPLIALSKVKELILTTPIRITDNTSDYYRNNAEYNFNLESDINLETGGYKIPADVITFPTEYSGEDISIDTSDIATGTVNIPVGTSEDVIFLTDESVTERHGKDLDKLDGPE